MASSPTPADEELSSRARYGTPDEVRAALAAGANIETVDRDGDTPLLGASYWNDDPAVAAFLIEQGARLDLVDDLGDTILHGFAHNGAMELVRLALARGLPVDGANSEGKTALHYAAANDKSEMLLLLVEHGASPSAITKGDHRTALHEAIVNFSGAATIAALVAAGSDVNARDNGGETPLLLAVEAKHAGGCAALLTHGVDVNAAAENGDTALIRAASQGAVELLAALVAAGADIDAKRSNGITALSAAALGRNPDAMWSLLNAGADRSVRDAYGHVALHHAGACATGVYLLERLASHHVGVDARTTAGCTALMVYALCNHLAPCGWLLELGADINARSNDGTTPLLFAARNGHAALVAMLLEAGADPSLAAHNGYDLAAARACHIEVEQAVAAWRARTAMQGVLGRRAGLTQNEPAGPSRTPTPPDGFRPTRVS